MKKPRVRDEQIIELPSLMRYEERAVKAHIGETTIGSSSARLIILLT